MQEVIENIVTNTEYTNEDKFKDLLAKCLKVSDESTKSTYAIHDNIMFKFADFMAGFRDFENHFGKDKKYKSGVHALSAITNELGFEFEDKELFILYHIKDLGKFRTKESKLFDELSKIWPTYKEFKLEKDELTYALKDLMRAKFIEYRRGNVTLNKNIIVRFRTQSPNRKKK